MSVRVLRTRRHRRTRHVDLPRLRPVALLPLVAAVVTGCSNKPPPDFAPAPGLLSTIQGLQVRTFPERVCPGRGIGAEYYAATTSGREIPFATRYDKDNPPPLHVVFLRRTSFEASPRENGSWDTYDDPVLSVMDGIRLHTAMRHKPSVADTTVIVPEYTCLPNAYGFEGPSGRRGGESGAPGPDVIVRLDILKSPYYERLLVAEIKVGAAPPFYHFADADGIPPSDWLIIESRGGRGGRGADGDAGADGSAGADGCPGGRGGAGGAGGNGGRGGAGGPGGRITVIAPSELPYLAGLVDARPIGGAGGDGGSGGKGGKGGAGGKAQPTTTGQSCAAGEQGPAGPDGRDGADGANGPPGPRPQVLTVPEREVFGPHVPRPLRDLLNYTHGSP